MALLSDLVAICEAQRLDTAATLTVFARRLREAGRISKAGRGRGAAHMTYLDAARFLIACAATDHPERAADAEFVFSNLVQFDAGSISDNDFRLTKADAPTLDLALAKTLEWLGSGRVDEVNKRRWQEQHPDNPFVVPAFVWLILRRSGVAELRVVDGRYNYHHPALAATVDSVSDEGGGHKALKVAEEAFERETYRFRTGKNLTAEIKGDLLRAVARLIVGEKVKK